MINAIILVHKAVRETSGGGDFFGKVYWKNLDLPSLYKAVEIIIGCGVAGLDDEVNVYQYP